MPASLCQTLFRAHMLANEGGTGRMTQVSTLHLYLPLLPALNTGKRPSFNFCSIFSSCCPVYLRLTQENYIGHKGHKGLHLLNFFVQSKNYPLALGFFFADPFASALFCRSCIKLCCISIYFVIK